MLAGLRDKAHGAHLRPPPEFHERAGPASARRPSSARTRAAAGTRAEGAAVAKLTDAGFDFNFPLAPLLRRARVDLVVLLDASEYKPGYFLGAEAAPPFLDGAPTRAVRGGGDTLDDAVEWAKCARSARRTGRYRRSARAQGRDAPVAIFPPRRTAPGARTAAARPDARGDAPQQGGRRRRPFDPLQNAADGGFCAVMNPRYEPEQFDALVEFGRGARVAAMAMPAIARRERRGAMAQAPTGRRGRAVQIPGGAAAKDQPRCSSVWPSSASPARVQTPLGPCSSLPCAPAHVRVGLVVGLSLT